MNAVKNDEIMSRRPAMRMSDNNENERQKRE